MGLPDFLKFVARSAPSALYRLPKNPDTDAAPLFEFDYVLVDATNVSQTVGFDRVHALLTSPLISVNKAVIFALDAQRERAGTDRFHRQAHIMVGDLDVQVQSNCTKLVDAYKKKQENAPQSGAAPLVLMSGRHVAGEADYKLLDLHRHIVCSALASAEARCPRVLFVSEDSDILCGALCGPAPQSVFIATNLRDTLFEMAVLQVSHVVAYVALCIDALAVPAPPEEPTPEPVLAEVEPPKAPVEAPPVHEAGFGSAEAARPPADLDVVRRRKPDGPMIATGVRIALDTSSSDDDEPDQTPSHTATAPAAAQPLSTPADQTTPAATEVKPSAVSVPLLAALDDPERPAAVMIHDSTVDFVFLFLVVMGNGGNVPPLVRGSTKVDVTSCWQAYCAKKFTQAIGPEAELGRTLLRADGLAGAGGDEQAVVRVNCTFFRAILEALHYADAQSRPPAEEEKGRALAYLSSAVYATLRYVVGCNLTSGAALLESFLDTRPLSDVEVVAPSLSAVLWLLSQDNWRQFTYPLRGLSRKELVALRDRHSHDESSTRAAPEAAVAAARATPHAGEHKRLQMDVTAALVAPPASASSWAVRGAGSRTYSLAAVIASVGQSRSAASVTRAGAAAAAAGSVSAQLRTVAAATQGKSTAPLFRVLLDVWRATEAPAVPAFRSIAATAAFLSPVTNTFVDGPLSRGKTWQGATPAPQKTGTAMVYSFELRRMVPVAAASAVHAAVADAGADQTAVQKPSASAALRAALGMSLSYDKLPAAVSSGPAQATPALKMPRQAMDEDDWAEIARLKKVARKEKDRLNRALARDASTAASASGAATAKSVKKPQPKKTDDPAAKRVKRPGKKERQRRQQEGASAGTAPEKSAEKPRTE